MQTANTIKLSLFIYVFILGVHSVPQHQELMFGLVAQGDLAVLNVTWMSDLHYMCHHLFKPKIEIFIKAVKQCG